MGASQASLLFEPQPDNGVAVDESNASQKKARVYGIRDTGDAVRREGHGDWRLRRTSSRQEKAAALPPLRLQKPPQRST